MMYFLAVPILQIWLKELSVSKTIIGYVALVAIPYTLKFLWAPLVGFIHIPWLGKRLGHRRSWLITSHFFLMLLLVLIGCSNPATHLPYTLCLAVGLTFFAGIQDIVIDAYRIEILDQKQTGAGVGMLMAGYRLGALTSQAGSLYLAAHFNWTMAYVVMAALVSMGVIAALLNPEPKVAYNLPQHHFFKNHVLPPLKDFWSRPGCWIAVVFMLTFKMGDAFIYNMANTFYLEVGFSKIEIAHVTKVFGMIPTLVGGLIGGMATMRFNLFSMLFYCGAIHALSHLMYVGQALLGYNIEWLYGLIFLENITGGITVAIFFVYLSRQVNLRYTATQYAFFTSIWSLSTVFASAGGALSQALDNWPLFFFCCFLISLPGLFLVSKIRQYPLANHGSYKG